MNWFTWARVFRGKHLCGIGTLPSVLARWVFCFMPPIQILNLVVFRDLQWTGASKKCRHCSCTWNQSWNPFADFVVLTLLFGFSLSLSSLPCRARRTGIVLGSLFVSIYYLHTRIISNGFTSIVQPKTNGITYFKRARAVHTRTRTLSNAKKGRSWMDFPFYTL